MNLKELINNLPQLSTDDFIYYNKLGSGSYAQVYSALHIPTNNIVAIKQIDLIQINMKNETQSILHELEFLRQTRSLSKFDFTPRFYGYFQNANFLNLVNEQCKYNLTDFINLRVLNAQESIVICAQVVSAVEKMHLSGFGHRDVKPDNFLLSERGLLITDFGTAKPLRKLDQEIISGIKNFKFQEEFKESVVGTEAFLPPESFEKGCPSQICIDFYGVGKVIEFVMRGQKNKLLGEVLGKLLHQDCFQRVVGGFQLVKKMQFFKGVEFEQQFNFQEKSFLVEKNLKIHQCHIQHKQLFEKNEKVQFAVEVLLKNRKATLFTTNKFKLFVVDDKFSTSLQMTNNLKIKEQKDSLIFQDTLQIEVFVQKEAKSQIIENVLKTFDCQNQIQQICKCGGVFEAGFCSQCGLFFNKGAKKNVQTVILQDCSILPLLLKQKILEIQLQTQEKEIIFAKENFETLFSPKNEENEWEIQIE